jgi:hypothetical protein
MAKENLYIKILNIMKVISKMIKDMDKVELFIQMEINLKVIL